ncbi:rhomboid family intramembrane serine protease [Crenothrix sp.]|uniref:rhomboid family intramembrane serine protease n=1 Tax=Crenothrix sp. TaxID=3100433 RepID=UPI00374DBD18
MIPIRDTAPCYSKPYVTWGLMIIWIVIFVSMKLMPDEMSVRLLNIYGMVPIRYSSTRWAAVANIPFDYYFSFISNLFLHGNWMHLVANLLFMWIFGDNVEDRMGRLPFLVFYLICGFFASILQWYFDPMLAIPVVGASGAIAGVLAAYFFLYPLERVILFLFPILVPVPAIAFLGIWVMIQLHDATTSVLFEGGTIDVAWWAHIGGFITGCILYRLFLKEQKV